MEINNEQRIKAILLVNMGSPSSEKEMKIFLRNMFLDPAIIPMPFFFRKMLSLFISNSRYKKSWAKYELIKGSPLLASDKNLARLLCEDLGNEYFVTNAFSYTQPSIEDKIATIYNKGHRELKVIPLYPQSSLTTTGSVKRDIQRINRKYKDLKITFNESFCNNSHFIQYWHTLIERALFQSFNSSLVNNSTNEPMTDKPMLVFSAHSIPEYNIRKGDTYVNEINESCSNIARSIGLNYRIAYQSKIGKMKWIGPDTKSLLKQLSEQEIKEVLIVPISFISENLETMYDLDIDIIPYAQKNLSFRNISRVVIPQSHPLMINTLRYLVKPE